MNRITRNIVSTPLHIGRGWGEGLLLASMFCLLLTGCKSLYGKYERPDVNTEGLYRDPVSLTDTLAVQDTTSFGTMPGARCSPTRSCRRSFRRPSTTM